MTHYFLLLRSTLYFNHTQSAFKQPSNNFQSIQHLISIQFGKMLSPMGPPPKLAGSSSYNIGSLIQRPGTPILELPVGFHLISSLSPPFFSLLPIPLSLPPHTCHHLLPICFQKLTFSPDSNQLQPHPHNLPQHLQPHHPRRHPRTQLPRAH